MSSWKKNQEAKVVTLDGKPEISYPCRWQYKLIGRIEELMHEEAKAIVAHRPHEIKQGNKSRTGKFVSIELVVEVQHEEERLFIYDCLTKSQVIMQVL